MIKAKRYLLKAREYLSNFKKVEKKSGPPKLKVTTKNTVNLAVIGGISFLLFVGLMGAIRAITLSNKVGTLQAQVEATQKQKAQPIALIASTITSSSITLMTMSTPTSPSHKKGINNKYKLNTSTVSITSFQMSKHKVKCVTQAPCSTHN